MVYVAPAPPHIGQIILPVPEQVGQVTVCAATAFADTMLAAMATNMLSTIFFMFILLVLDYSHSIVAFGFGERS